MSKMTITIKNTLDGLRLIFVSDIEDKQICIVKIKNRIIDQRVLDKLLMMDLIAIGIYNKFIMIEIFESIKKIVSNLILRKGWSVSFNKDIK